MVSFQGFAAAPWFDCFSIAHRVKDGLRPSLTRHPIEKDLACIGSAARVWRSGFSLGACLGLWVGRARAARCLVGAYGSGRDLVNRSQVGRRFGRGGFGAGRVISSPLIRRVPHGRGGSPSSGAWGTFPAVGKCPHQQGSGERGVEGPGPNAPGAPRQTASTKLRPVGRGSSGRARRSWWSDSSPRRLRGGG